MPLSSDPAKRARQVANLKQGGTVAPDNARSHGGYARIAAQDVDRKRTEIREALAEDAPLRDAVGELPAHDALAVSLLAETLLRLERVRDFLDRRGWETDDGEVRPAVDLERKLRAEAWDAMRELGLTPASRSKLGLDLVKAHGAVEEAEAARAARERLDQRLAEIDHDQGGDDGATT